MSRGALDAICYGATRHWVRTDREFIEGAGGLCNPIMRA